MTERSVAPWTQQQVDHLNGWQRSPYALPFTCANREDHPLDPEGDYGVLVATVDGWVCRHCDYHQNWAHAFMINTPLEPFEEMSAISGKEKPESIVDQLRWFSNMYGECGEDEIIMLDAANYIEHLEEEVKYWKEASGKHDPTGANHMEDAARLASENDDLRSRVATLVTTLDTIRMMCAYSRVNLVTIDGKDAILDEIVSRIKELPYGPGHPEWCSNADDNNTHCVHWWDCEPCCRCGDDTPDPECDCDRCSALKDTTKPTG